MKKEIYKGLVAIICAAIGIIPAFIGGKQSKENEIRNELKTIVNIDNGDISTVLKDIIQEYKLENARMEQELRENAVSKDSITDSSSVSQEKNINGMTLAECEKESKIVYDGQHYRSFPS